jgi:putative spermidine/putrescine transport system permease protein
MRIVHAFTLVTLLLLMAPLLAIVPLSFTSGTLLSLPIPGWSWRWYGDFFHDPRWLSATRTSVELGALTVLCAVPLGTAAALGLHFGRVPARTIVLAVLVAPVVVPSVITGLALYFAFARIGLNSTLPGLVLAHTILTSPYTVTAVLAGLQGLDPALLPAARGLGAGPAAAFTRILAPILAPSIAAGAIFAFAVSFDELVITLFLAGPEQTTLPRQMYAGLHDTLSPTLAAAAVLVALASLVLLAAWRSLTHRPEAKDIHHPWT